MKKALLWVIWNLIFSNFILNLLPANAFSFFIGMWMPAISSIVFLKIERISLKTGLNWEIGSFKSYLISFSIPLVVAAITIVIGLLTKKLTLNPDHQVNILSGIITLIIWFFSSIGEELGWRGYLHNHFRELKHAPLLIGLIWGFWHYRQLIDSHSSIWVIINFSCLTILASYFLCWIIENKGSVIGCGLFHGLWNFLRLKVLFGNPAYGNKGLFLSSNPQLTEMEGFFGVIALSIATLPFIFMWYKNKKSEV